jgi:Domain of unknown function (DUF5664)
MTPRFKVGDRVRVTQQAPLSIQGHLGTITETYRKGRYPYEALVDNDPFSEIGPWRLADCEIEPFVNPSPEGSTKKMLLPAGSKERKDIPIATGVMDYFPLALAYVARVSKAGNDKHNPGQYLHWDKTKSKDHADCIARHLIDRGTIDPDSGLLHEGSLAWRALALLETALGNGSVA